MEDQDASRDLGSAVSGEKKPTRWQLIESGFYRGIGGGLFWLTAIGLFLLYRSCST